jgi:hypothetical protein
VIYRMHFFHMTPVGGEDVSFAYNMGLRGPRCNGCKYARLKHELGDRFREIRTERGWIVVFELDVVRRTREKLQIIAGRPAKRVVAFLSIGHSDECYHWKPKKQAGL